MGFQLLCVWRPTRTAQPRGLRYDKATSYSELLPLGRCTRGCLGRRYYRTMNYKTIQTGALWTNCYIFWSSNSGAFSEAFCVDPGGSTKTDILPILRAYSLDLTMILLTHGHIDHIAGLPDLLPLVKDKIYIGLKDASMLRHPSSQLQDLLGVNFTGVDKFRVVSDGDILGIPGYRILVISTPGHTPGSVSYLITDDSHHQVLLSGDTLFAQSVGRTDLEGGDYTQLQTSLQLLDALPDDLIVLPGHGPSTTIATEREMNPYWPR